MANRVISMNRDHARGVRFPSTVRDEIDAAVAGHINAPASSSRSALDGRYRTTVTAVAPGTVDITIGTGVDEGGGDPVSVSDEAVTALVMNLGSTTRHALDELYSDDDILTDADVANYITTNGTATRTALINLINATAPGGGVGSDADIAAIINSGGSATRLLLNSIYGIPAEIRSGAAPVGAPHANAGVGAALTSGGTRIAFRCVITTGASPTPGGILAVFTLTDYTLGPVVMINPRDAQSYNVKPFVLASNTQLQVIAGGEVDAYTGYTFDIMVQGF